MKRLLIVLAIIIAQAIPATAQSREKGLNDWMDKSLVPYVQQQLVKHPRFKNETVMFVVLGDNAPAPVSNALALSLRNQLLSAAVDTSGISIGWLQGRSSNVTTQQASDCQHNDVHYYIGIELEQELDSSYSVNVRALDLEDRTWVTGFGKRWQGRLSTVQRQAMRQRRVDNTFLGARDVPFTADQTDLLASYLAHQLTCTLQAKLEDEYIVAPDLEADTSLLHGTVELIGNNLARQQALQLTSDATKGNSVLSGKAHRVDGNLHQYWITVTPELEQQGLSALSASAYVIMPIAQETRPAVATVAEPVTVMTPASTRKPDVVSIPNAGDDGLISQLHIAAPDSIGECQWPCSMLRARANTDAIVFFLKHQANHGLVRLSGGECRQRSVARIARDGEILSFPISKTTTDSRKIAETFEWALRPKLDTYYAVVATDADIARRMANHIDKLPLRCTDSLRPGLNGPKLEAWLNDFASFSSRSSQHLDWRAIQVRDLM